MLQDSTSRAVTPADSCDRAVLCFVLWIGSIRINLWFVLVFFSLVMMFSFSAAADMAVPNAKTTAEAEHILKLLKFAGGFGFIALVCGW